MKSEKLIGEKILPNKRKKTLKNLPVLDNDENNPCDFYGYGYSIESLMKETSELR